MCGVIFFGYHTRLFNDIRYDKRANVLTQNLMRGTTGPMSTQVRVYRVVGVFTCVGIYGYFLVRGCSPSLGEVRNYFSLDRATMLRVYVVILFATFIVGAFRMYILGDFSSFKDFTTSKLAIGLTYERAGDTQKQGCCFINIFGLFRDVITFFCQCTFFITGLCGILSNSAKRGGTIGLVNGRLTIFCC